MQGIQKIFLCGVVFKKYVKNNLSIILNVLKREVPKCLWLAQRNFDINQGSFPFHRMNIYPSFQIIYS